MRFSRSLALALTLVAIGMLAGPAPSMAAPASAPPTAQTATIDLGGLFGDENEPDEDEPDEGSQHSRAASSQQGSGTSFSALLLAVGAGMVAMVFATRWFFRVRSWVRQLGRGRAA